MQSKGLALPRHPYKTVLCVSNNSTNALRSGGCLTTSYSRYKIKSRLDSFKIFTSEQSDPSPEPSSSESEETNKEFVSLSSWAEDVSQPTSTTDDWGRPAARLPGRHPLANALFVLSLGGIAVGAFFLGKKYSAYNQAMTSETQTAELGSTTKTVETHTRKDAIKTKEAAPTTTPTTTTKDATADAGASAGHKIMIIPTLPKDKESRHAPSTEKRSIDSSEKDSVAQVVENAQENAEQPILPPPPPPPAGEETLSLDSKETESKDTDLPSPSSLFDNVVTVEEKNKEEQDEELLEAPVAAAKEEKEKEQEDSPPPPPAPSSLPKLPLRTAEAEAALERIRAIQQRRQNLYDRAIARQENKLTPLSSTSASATEEAEKNPPPPPTVLPSGSLYADEVVVENNETLEIPEGMSLLELRERAAAANKAAAASATAAHKAAMASALAADAADTATHAAEQASLAAARCQGALDMRSADAIEEAFKVATEAEETAETASRKAAVNSAKAVISKRDAEKKEEIANKAAQLSKPHGIVAQTSAVWRQLRRDSVTAVETTSENVKAGVAAAGWMWNQGAAKVEYFGKGVADNVQNLVKAVQERLPAAAEQPAPPVVEKKKKWWGGKKEVPKIEEARKGWFGRSKAKK